MKPVIYACILGIGVCLSACLTSNPTYFGAKHTPTDTIQTFYAAKDVGRPYKVIGHMIAPITRSGQDQDKVERRLIEKAKQVGANGLIFSDIIRQTHQKTTDDFSIKAEAIVFIGK